MNARRATEAGRTLTRLLIEVTIVDRDRNRQKKRVRGV